MLVPARAPARPTGRPRRDRSGRAARAGRRRRRGRARRCCGCRGWGRRRGGGPPSPWPRSRWQSARCHQLWTLKKLSSRRPVRLARDSSSRCRPGRGPASPSRGPRRGAPSSRAARRRWPRGRRPRPARSRRSPRGRRRTCRARCCGRASTPTTAAARARCGRAGRARWRGRSPSGARPGAPRRSRGCADVVEVHARGDARLSGPRDAGVDGLEAARPRGDGTEVRPPRATRDPGGPHEPTPEERPRGRHRRRHPRAQHRLASRSRARAAPPRLGPGRRRARQDRAWARARPASPAAACATST